MSESKNTAAGGGIGFVGLLTIAFIVLKLCKVIAWKWIWVFSPIWISAGITILILLAYFLIAYLLIRRR